MNTKTYRVTVTYQACAEIQVDAESPEEANLRAIEQIQSDSLYCFDEYLGSKAVLGTKIEVND